MQPLGVRNVWGRPRSCRRISAAPSGAGPNYTPLKASLLALSYSHKPEIGGLAPAEPVLGLAGGHWKPRGS